MDREHCCVWMGEILRADGEWTLGQNTWSGKKKRNKLCKMPANARSILFFPKTVRLNDRVLLYHFTDQEPTPRVKMTWPESFAWKVVDLICNTIRS